MPKQKVMVSLSKKNKKRVQLLNRTLRPNAAKEIGLLGQALRGLGGMGGAAIGGYFGNAATGGAVGTGLGAAISKWLGAGDYTVDSNSVVKSSLKAASSIPMMHKDGQTVVVRHREFVGSVASSTTFSVQRTLTLNPGNKDTFPWLSGIAQNFQEYKFRGVVFHYIPSSGAAVSGTSPALGTVMFQTSYRVTDDPPGSKAEMMNEYCANEVVPSDTMAHPIECDPKENPFNIQYVRTRPVPTADSALMYDLGETHVATQGQLASGNVLGDIWVTYEVELKKPVVKSNVTYEGVALTCQSLLATAGELFPQPNQTVSGQGSALFSGQAVIIPPGSGKRFQFLMRCTGASNWAAATMNQAPTGLLNCTLVNWVDPSSNVPVGTQTNASLGSAFQCFAIEVINTQTEAAFRPTVTLTGNANFTSQATLITILE